MSDYWLYDPNYCDGHYCPANCDKCSYAERGEEVTVKQQLAFKQTECGRRLAANYEGSLEAMGYQYAREETTKTIIISWWYEYEQTN